jgi:hypothetical protein
MELEVRQVEERNRFRKALVKAYFHIRVEDDELIWTTNPFEGCKITKHS